MKLEHKYFMEGMKSDRSHKYSWSTLKMDYKSASNLYCNFKSEVQEAVF